MSKGADDRVFPMVCGLRAGDGPVLCSNAEKSETAFRILRRERMIFGKNDNAMLFLPSFFDIIKKIFFQER